MQLSEVEFERLATASLAGGDLAQAEAHCHQGLESDPKSYRLRVLQAVILREKGEFVDAAGVAEQAIAIRPTMVEAYFQLALNCIDLSRLGAAEGALRKAIELRPDVGVFKLNLGLVYERTGRLASAKKCFETCLAQDPSQLQARLWLASQLIVEDQLEAANTHAEMGLRSAPRSVAAHLAMAEVRLADDDTAAADKYIASALMIDPNSGSALNMLGFRQLQLGQFDAAEATFKQAIELNPIQGHAYLGLSQTKKLRIEMQQVLRDMEELCGNHSLSTAEQSSLHFALAKGYDDLRMYESAMQSYDRAQDLAAKARFGSGSFNPEIYRQSIASIRNAYDANRMEQKWEAASDSDLPILVVGMIRSGTTLVEQILSSHSEVGAAGESPFWKRCAGNSQTLCSLSDDSQLGCELGKAYVQALHKAWPGSLRVVDKLPGNYLRLGLIRQALPNAKIIHCRRSPLDTALSIFVTPNRFAPSFSHSKEGIVFAYRQYLDLMEHWRHILPASGFLEIQYEDLVGNPEPAIRQMLEFCELDWSEACLTPELNSKEVLTPSLWQVRQPINQSSVQKWRRYEPWLGVLKELADESS